MTYVICAYSRVIWHMSYAHIAVSYDMFMRNSGYHCLFMIMPVWFMVIMMLFSDMYLRALSYIYQRWWRQMMMMMLVITNDDFISYYVCLSKSSCIIWLKAFNLWALCQKVKTQCQGFTETKKKTFKMFLLEHLKNCSSFAHLQQCGFKRC